LREDLSKKRQKLEQSVQPARKSGKNGQKRVNLRKNGNLDFLHSITAILLPYKSTCRRIRGCPRIALTSMMEVPDQLMTSVIWSYLWLCLYGPGHRPLPQKNCANHHFENTRLFFSSSPSFHRIDTRVWVSIPSYSSFAYLKTESLMVVSAHTACTFPHCSAGFGRGVVKCGFVICVEV
jgi:hypothetical protein